MWGTVNAKTHHVHHGISSFYDQEKEDSSGLPNCVCGLGERMNLTEQAQQINEKQASKHCNNSPPSKSCWLSGWNGSGDGHGIAGVAECGRGVVRLRQWLWLFKWELQWQEATLAVLG